MIFVNFIENVLHFISNFIKTTEFLILVIIIIILYHLGAFYLRDKRFLKALNNHIDSKKIILEDLNNFPLVNIIIPAWKENKKLDDCLSSILEINYPNLKVIVNAGGNDETVRIANSFKRFENFILLEQKPGGKMKAINECLDHVSKGIVYSIDADVILTNEIFIRMIHPIINQNENVTAGGIRPYLNQEKEDLVKYILIKRYPYFKQKFSRYSLKQISGPNTCIKYHVIKTINRFHDDDSQIAADRFRGYLLTSKGFKLYRISDFRASIYTNFPIKIKSYFKQEVRWLINTLTNKYYKKRIQKLVKFSILVLFSLFLIISPFLFIFNYLFLLLWLLVFLNFYLKKIRKYLFFWKNITKNEIVFSKFKLIFFLKIFFYIFVDIFINIYTGFKLIKNIFKK